MRKRHIKLAKSLAAFLLILGCSYRSGMQDKEVVGSNEKIVGEWVFNSSMQTYNARLKKSQRYRHVSFARFREISQKYTIAFTEHGDVLFPKVFSVLDLELMAVAYGFPFVSCEWKFCSESKRITFFNFKTTEPSFIGFSLIEMYLASCGVISAGADSLPVLKKTIN